MNLKYFILIISLTLSFTSCQDLVHNEKIIEGFYLIAVDINEDMDLSYEVGSGNFVGIIGQTVFAVGFNKNYIIAKQHPYNNRKITNYYIVMIDNLDPLWPEKNVIGPFTKQEFNLKRQELNITDIKFTKVIRSLE